MSGKEGAFPDVSGVSQPEDFIQRAVRCNSTRLLFYKNLPLFKHTLTF
jgi:hypothetical protein